MVALATTFRVVSGVTEVDLSQELFRTDSEERAWKEVARVREAIVEMRLPR